MRSERMAFVHQKVTVICKKRAKIPQPGDGLPPPAPPHNITIHPSRRCSCYEGRVFVRRVQNAAYQNVLDRTDSWVVFSCPMLSTYWPYFSNSHDGERRQVEREGQHREMDACTTYFYPWKEVKSGLRKSCRDDDSGREIPTLLLAINIRSSPFPHYSLYRDPLYHLLLSHQVSSCHSHSILFLSPVQRSTWMSSSSMRRLNASEIACGKEWMDPLAHPQAMYFVCLASTVPQPLFCEKSFFSALEKGHLCNISYTLPLFELILCSLPLPKSHFFTCKTWLSLGWYEPPLLQGVLWRKTMHIQRRQPYTERLQNIAKSRWRGDFSGGLQTTYCQTPSLFIRINRTPRLGNQRVWDVTGSSSSIDLGPIIWR